MSNLTLIRLGGLAAVVGGAVILLSDITGLLVFDFDDAFSEVVATGI